MVSPQISDFLLEPRCTRIVTISRHRPQPDMEEPVSGNLFFKTKHLSRTKPLPSHIHEKIWPRSTQFWLGFLGFSSILEVTFWDTLYTILGEKGVLPKKQQANYPSIVKWIYCCHVKSQLFKENQLIHSKQYPISQNVQENNTITFFTGAFREHIGQIWKR